MILCGRAEWCWGFLREGRAEPCPYGVGGCKREVQRNKREKQGNKKGNAKGEGKEKEKEKKKQAVSAIIRESGAFGGVN